MIAKDYFKLIRVKQLPKNFLVLLPPFASKAFDEEKLVTLTIQSLIAVSIFTLVSTLVYINNDLHDLDADRLSSKKRLRPLASGKISVNTARVFIGALCAALLATMLQLSIEMNTVLLIYVSVNILYTQRLKEIAYLDLFCVSSGYVLRILFGASFFDLPASNWLLICVMCTAFGITAGKRYSELVYSKAKSEKISRNVLKSYSEQTLRTLIIFCLSASFVTYLIWSLEKFEYSLTAFISVVLVFFLFAQVLISIDKEEMLEPEQMLYSKTNMLAIILWITCFLMLG